MTTERTDDGDCTDDDDDDVDIGGLGENALDRWCLQVGITPNPAKHDKKGFDNMLVLPKPKDGFDPRTPLDLDPPEFTCIVQVKATYDADKPRGVKLSNWKRLAQWPDPTFYLVVELDRTTKEPRRAFLVHVWDYWIARVLKRLRETPTTERDRLHIPKMNLTVREDELLSGLHGNYLLAALRKHIGPDALAYFKAKQRLIEDIGYDERPYRVNITFGDEPDDEFFDKAADFALGLIDKMPIKRLRVRKVRFDVPEEVKDVTEEMHIVLPEIPPQMNAVLEVTEIDTLESVRINVKVFSAVMIFPFLPPKYRRVALKADGMTIVLRPAGDGPFMTTNFHFPDLNDERPIGDAAATAKFARLLFDGRVRLAFITPDKRFEFADGRESRAVDGFVDYARIIEDADLVMRRFQIPLDTKVKFGRLVAQDDALRMLGSIIEPSLDPINGAHVTFEANNAPENKVEKAALVAPVTVFMGEWAILVIMAAFGPTKWNVTEDGEAEMVIEQKGAIRLSHVLPIRDMKQFRVLPLIRRVVEQLKKEGAELVIGEPPAEEQHPALEEPKN